MRRFPRRARAEQGGVRRSVPHRAVARHHRVDRAERALRHVRALSRRARRRAAGRIRGDRRATASCCSSIAPTSRSSATRPIATARSPTSSASSRLVVAAINKALRNIPRDRVRLHVCWGNYEGPHDRDVALRDILPVILKAKAGGVLPAVRQSAPRARVPGAARTIPLADDQLLIAGVIDTLTNFVEHPEVVADRIERDRRRGRRSAPRAGRRPIAASTPRPAWAASPRTSSGRSCARCGRRAARLAAAVCRVSGCRARD